MIKYIGSKRLLVPHILRAVAAFPQSGRVLDLFSGTSRVARGLKETGRYVIANDHLAYASTLARCYVQADAKRWLDEAERLIADLSRVSPEAGYFTRAFCDEARYFKPKNGARVDAIREDIARRDLPAELEAIALVSLMEAADRVDSTTGVQMAYLKQWAARASNDLALRVPAILPGPGEAHHLDAVDAASRVEADIAYIDPPYNQHSYMGNYHVWESLVRWDKPETYGVANKRVQCKEYKSDFNSKRRIHRGLKDVFEALRCRHLLVSFNNEGHVDREEMIALLSERGHVGVVAVDFKRYVGAQIGIHSPSGEKVGRVSHLRNKEYIFVVSDRRDTVESVVAAVEASIETAALASKPAKRKRKDHESERRAE
ncbi:MAG: DNA adenine methylase [Deltaproteobacteria bacterium]|nr:DNA adenine methylase [Deltaproteobacteria bacterium]NND28902.1 DNA methyltransferase [Myxococcales bacterium]MBT8464083.1 DNA adenine methylase [Deltaproteobacteria bacterium]MBT8483321.1 DNA adenine methylase [Deltaproteobacteria bacterium]NNK05944.1 DNA methyltransferase [Myxococcales bacterium]